MAKGKLRSDKLTKKPKSDEPKGPGAMKYQTVRMSPRKIIWTGKTLAAAENEGHDLFAMGFYFPAREAEPRSLALKAALDARRAIRFSAGAYDISIRKRTAGAVVLKRRRMT
jgi:hypothetical protein